MEDSWLSQVFDKVKRQISGAGHIFPLEGGGERERGSEEARRTRSRTVEEKRRRGEKQLLMGVRILETEI